MLGACSALALASKNEEIAQWEDFNAARRESTRRLSHRCVETASTDVADY